MCPKCTSEMAYYVTYLDGYSSVVLVATEFEWYGSDYQCQVLEYLCYRVVRMLSDCKFQGYDVQGFFLCLLQTFDM